MSSARVMATYSSRRSSSTRRCSSWRRCSEILSDSCFRLVTSEVSSTGMPSAPAEARSPRNSGGSSAASVSQVLRDAVDGKIPPDRCATATTCHSKPFAECTVSTWTRSRATANGAGGKPFSTDLGRRPGRPTGPHTDAVRTSVAPSRRVFVRRNRRRRRRTRRGVRCRPSRRATPAAARTSQSTPSTRRTSATRSGRE